MNNNTEIQKFETKTGKEWKNIKSANKLSVQNKKKLLTLLNEPVKLLSGDCELVVFGSLARNEFTKGSDLDWTLLIDGQVKVKHQDLAVKLRKRMIEKGFNDPGSSGIFGGLTFSHDLVHYIGGSEDINKNMTRRLLLLLESEPIIKVGDQSFVYNKVVRSVISRYLQVIGDYKKNKFPRFLVNDMIRFWRTLCVDFAAKEWQQSDNKWVIRNVKLRFSRKLLFVTGMLTCLALYKQKLNEEDAVKRVELYVKTNPLEILAKYINEHKILKSTGIKLFSSYDMFLGILQNNSKRKSLMNLRPEQIDSNKLFQSLRLEGHKFQKSLIELFFEKGTPLRDFTKQYGVF